MMRIPYGMDWCDLDQLAEDIGATLVYRKARCQHGYTRSEHCVSCDGGYATDHATYAAGIRLVATLDGEPCIAVSDDGEDVAYLPARYQARVKHEPIQQLKAYAQGRKTRDGLERLIQRILGRAYWHTLSEINRTAEVVPVPVGNVDSAAWTDVRQDATARHGVRFLPDGSAVTTHYTADGLPLYRRFVRA